MQTKSLTHRLFIGFAATLALTPSSVYAQSGSTGITYEKLYETGESGLLPPAYFTFLDDKFALSPDGYVAFSPQPFPQPSSTSPDRFLLRRAPNGVTEIVARQGQSLNSVAGVQAGTSLRLPNDMTTSNYGTLVQHMDFVLGAQGRLAFFSELSGTSVTPNNDQLALLSIPGRPLLKLFQKGDLATTPIASLSGQPRITNISFRDSGYNSYGARKFYRTAFSPDGNRLHVSYNTDLYSVSNNLSGFNGVRLYDLAANTSEVVMAPGIHGTITSDWTAVFEERAAMQNEISAPIAPRFWSANRQNFLYSVVVDPIQHVEWLLVGEQAGKSRRLLIPWVANDTQGWNDASTKINAPDLNFLYQDTWRLEDFINSASINDSGTIALAANLRRYLREPFRAILRGRHGLFDRSVEHFEFDLLAREGQQISANPADGVLQFVETPSIKIVNSNDVIFQARIANAGPNRDQYGAGLFRIDTVGVLHPIITSLMPLPGLPTSTRVDWLNPVMFEMSNSSFLEWCAKVNDRGSVAVLVSLNTQTSIPGRNDEALFLYKNGSLNLVAKTGQLLPGSTNRHILSLSGFSALIRSSITGATEGLTTRANTDVYLLNNQDQLVIVPYTETDSGNNPWTATPGWFPANSLTIDKVLAYGSDEILRTISANDSAMLSLFSSSSTTVERPRFSPLALMQPETLNDRGQLLLKMEKGDFSSPDALQYRAALVQVNIGNTSGECHGDYDGDGTVDIDDIFSFMNDWTSHRLTTDMNHDGLVSVQDLFDYINLWFRMEC